VQCRKIIFQPQTVSIHAGKLFSSPKSFQNKPENYFPACFDFISGQKIIFCLVSETFLPGKLFSGINSLSEN
jgi:hypothetical protein